MLKASFEKETSTETTYLKPELYSLGRATFLTHGSHTSGTDTEKCGETGQEQCLHNCNG